MIELNCQLFVSPLAIAFYVKPPKVYSGTLDCLMKTFGKLMLFLLLPLIQSWGVQQYFPVKEASFDERWRWTELEAISKLGATEVGEGLNGELWFAGRREVVLYDGTNVEHYPLSGDEYQDIDGFYVSRGGQVYVLFDEQLLMLREGKWETLFEVENPQGRDVEICESESGGIWLGLASHLYFYESGRVSEFPIEMSFVFSMILDREGKLWLTQENDDVIHIYDTSKLESESLNVSYGISTDGESDYTRLFLDSDGRVWVLNPDELGRCYLYDGYEKQLAVEGLTAPHWYTHNLKMTELAKGHYWFCVARRMAEYRNGSRTILTLEDFPLPTSNSYVLALSGERLLIGGRESSAHLIDFSDNRFASYRDLNYQCEDLRGNRWFIDHEGRLITFDIVESNWLAFDETDGIIDSPNNALCGSDGTVWVSGRHGKVAAVSHNKYGKWERMLFPETGVIFSHLSAIETSDGSVVFGAGTPVEGLGDKSGGGVVIKETRGVVEATHVAPPVFPRRSAIIVERKKDGFWFGGDTLRHYQGNGMLGPERVEPFESNSWTDDIAVDSNDDLWVAAWGKGVYQFTGDSYRLHSEEYGLRSNEIINILAARHIDGLWIATGKGLSRFDGQSWSNWDFNDEDRFIRENITLGESKDGSLWINYAYRTWLLNGIRDEDQKESYRVIRYKSNDLPPHVDIVKYESDLPEGSPVLLSWAGMDSWSETPSDELEYSWRLGKGNWSHFSKETSVALNNVKAGEHAFEVKARDRDWNVSADASQVSITVIPPLWKRPWFALIVIGTASVIVILLYTLFKVRVRSAIAMEEFKLDFFTNISHELKNPLAVIVGPLESLLRKEQPPKTRQNLQIALRNARKMQGLVGQLLQFRKLELGKAGYRPSHGELIGFLHESVESHAPLWKAKGQSIVVETNPKYCNCGYDSDKLQKIIDNLVSNAIKYSPEGGDIRVSLEVTTENGHKEARLVVEDHGVGIPQHEIDLVLKPFYRVNGSGEKKEGFGIGLSLVDQLVQLWGGEIELKSPIGPGKGGTRVTVSLPLEDSKETHSGNVATDALESIESVREEEDMQSPKILLVEDNEDLRLFMREELSDQYLILEASDGEEGLLKALKENPDLVITDVMMPKMDGFELCQKLKLNSETSHIPIIILTAKGSEEDSMTGIEAGADAYFAKPLNMLRLLAQIENVLELRHRLKLRFSEQLIIEPTELTVTSTDESILRKAIDIVSANMGDEDFDVDQFAREMAMSRATLYRKLKALTGQPPSPFIRSMRLKRAAQLLSKGGLSVSEVLDHVGILDLSYFSRIFKKEFGVSPSHYGERIVAEEKNIPSR